MNRLGPGQPLALLQKESPDFHRGFREIVLTNVDYFRRRKISNAAEPRPTNAKVAGSGTGTANSEKPLLMAGDEPNRVSGGAGAAAALSSTLGSGSGVFVADHPPM